MANKRKNNDISIKMNSYLGATILTIFMAMICIIVGTAKAYFDLKIKDQNIVVVIGNATQANVTVSDTENTKFLVPSGADLDASETYRLYLGKVDIQFNDEYLTKYPNMYMMPRVALDGTYIDGMFNIEMESLTHEKLGLINVNSYNEFELMVDNSITNGIEVDSNNISYGLYISFSKTNDSISNEEANSVANRNMIVQLSFSENAYSNSFKISSQVTQSKYNNSENEFGNFVMADNNTNGITISLDEENILGKEIYLGTLSNGLDPANLFFKAFVNGNETDLFKLKLEYNISLEETDYEFLSKGEYINLEKSNYKVYLQFSNSASITGALSHIRGQVVDLELIYAPTNIIEL